MSNPNNLIRPPVLSNSVSGSNASQNAQSSIEDLTSLISNIASNVLRRYGPQVIHAAHNPNNNLDNVRDQQIDNRHRENLNDINKIPEL